jgi:hypothetical protein
MGKPCVSFNRVAVMVNAIGKARRTTGRKCSTPRTIDDSGVNDLLTDAAKWARDHAMRGRGVGCVS